MGEGLDGCSTLGCSRTSRWPRPRRTVGFCDECLVEMVQACSASVVTLPNGPRDRIRTRHDPCAAIVDVSLAMLRRGGWVCQMCRRTQNLANLRTQSWYLDQDRVWPVALQEQVLTTAGLRPLHPLGDADRDEPVNVKCLECGGASVDTLFGFAEGIRLSWLPCPHCNAARFRPTTETVAARLTALGMELLDDFDGDPARPLRASCRRCYAPRSVAWQAIGSGSPPCLRCDGARLDPGAPHRVYLIHFPHLGEVGVYKVGITHCADDNRLKAHQRAGGTVIQTVQVRDRAHAFALERHVLERYQSSTPVMLARDLLPQGGTTECWAAYGGHPDLHLAAAAMAR